MMLLNVMDASVASRYFELMERTTISRRTLAAALTTAVVFGSGAAAAVGAFTSDDEGPRPDRIAEVGVSSSSSDTTITPAPETTAAPVTTQAPAPVPIEQQVADHEQRIDTLEATTTTTTTAAPATTTTTLVVATTTTIANDPS